MAERKSGQENLATTCVIVDSKLAWREIGRLLSGDPDSYRPNLTFMWGAQPHKGLIYFNDVNSDLWIVKLGDKIDKGSTTAPGQ